MANYTEKDVVKHWGLRDKDSGEWLLSGNDLTIIAFTCPRVLEVQLKVLKDIYGEDGKINDVQLNNLEVAEVKL